MTDTPLTGSPIPRSAAPPPRSGGMPALAVMVIVVAGLYFGREIFVPIALAMLLSFALSPPVSWLRRYIPKTPAVVTVVLLAFVAIFAFGIVVAGQVAELAEDLPRYQNNIQTKIRSLRGQTGGGVVERASEVLRELGEEIEGANEEEAAAPTPLDPAEEPEPIPVEIQQPDPAPLQVLQNIIGPLLAPLATGGIVIVFVIFILLQREDLRDRFIRLAGTSDLHRTTQAITDAGDRVAHYLLMQLIVNATYGIPVGLGLWLIGVPNPLLWGVLAMILRFVPYVGPIIAAMFPLALSIAVDPGWTMLLWTGALFILLELLSNNIVEPWLYGSSTGLSPVAIIVAAIFWTWLWGPVGLLLSTPLTVCLVVLGRHVPQFGFLDVLLGSEPVLTSQESLYQRLLADDPEEATARAEEFLEEKPLLAFYDEVVVPALVLMEHDRIRGTLTPERRDLVVSGLATIIDNLSEHEDIESEKGEANVPAAHAETDHRPGWKQDHVVLCAGGRNNLDDTAAAIAAQLLERRGLGARAVPCEAISAAGLPKLDATGVRMAFVAYMNPDSVAHARYAARRLRKRLPGIPIMIGFLSLDGEEEKAERTILAQTGADFLVTSLAEAVDRATAVVGGAEGSSVEPAPPPSKASSAAGPAAKA